MWTFAFGVLGCQGPKRGSESAPPTESAGEDADTDTDTDADTDADTDTDTDTGPTPAHLGALTFSDGRIPRNVLVITLDTTRRDAFAAWGGRKDTLPFMDSRIAASFVLEHTRSCTNWTVPAVACLYTGQNTIDLQYDPLAVDDAANYFPIDPWWLPFGAREEGVQTFLVSGNVALDVWFGLEGAMDPGFSIQRVEHDAPATWITDETSKLFADGSLDPGTPWLGHLQYFDPHHAYAPPAEWLSELDTLAPLSGFDLSTSAGTEDLVAAYYGLEPSLQDLARQHLDARYRAENRYMDAEIERLWTELDASGHLDDTLVVWWADHGEQFWEHDTWGHGVSMHHAETEIALGFWSKSLVPGVHLGRSELEDVTLVLSDLFGLPRRKGFRGSLPGEEPKGRVRVSYQYQGAAGPRLAVDQDGLKILYNWDGSIEAYDPSDPGETSNVWDPADPELAALWGAAEVEIERVRAYMPHLVPVLPGP